MSKCLICDKKTDKCVHVTGGGKFYHCNEHGFEAMMYAILKLGNNPVLTADSWLQAAKKPLATKKPKKKRGNKS